MPLLDLFWTTLPAKRAQQARTQPMVPSGLIQDNRWASEDAPASGQRHPATTEPVLDPGPGLWWPWTMKIIILILATLLPTLALAEPIRQTYRDANGREFGRSTTDARGNTVYRDNMARTTGRSVTSGGTKTFMIGWVGRRAPRRADDVRQDIGAQAMTQGITFEGKQLRGWSYQSAAEHGFRARLCRRLDGGVDP